MELRRRKKEEANAALETRLSEMKRKARESEDWQRRKARLLEGAAWPFCVGLAMCAAAGTYYYYYH